MVYVTSIYDDKLHKEVFKVTGEKGYVKTTDTVLKQVSVSKSLIDYAVVTVKVNVFGDRGSSQIIFYDNDKLIPFWINNTRYTYLSWNLNSSETTVTLRLNYNAEHKIKAVYKGNDNCLGSSSNVLQPNTDVSSTFQSVITLTSSSNSYEQGTNITFSGTLKNGAGTALANQSVEIYDGTTLLDTVTTDSSGNYSYRTNSLSVAVHNIKAKFSKTANNYGSEATKEIGVGRILEVTQVSDFIEGVGTIKVKSYNQFGSELNMTVANADILSNGVSVKNKFNVSVSSKTLTFSATNQGAEMPSSVVVQYLTYATEPITIKSAYIHSLTLTPQLPIEDNLVSIGEGEVLPLNIKATAKNYDGTTVSTKGLTVSTRTENFRTPLSDVVLNAKGEGTTYYIGNGAGIDTIHSELGFAYDEIDVEDCIIYISSSKSADIGKIKSLYGDMVRMNKGIKLTIPTAQYNGMAVNSVSIVGLGEGTSFNDVYWTVKFKVVSSVSDIGLFLGTWQSPKEARGSVDDVTLSLNANDKVELSFNDGIIEAKVNNVVKAVVIDIPRNYPAFGIVGAGGKSILIDDIKMVRS